MPGKQCPLSENYLLKLINKFAMCLLMRKPTISKN